MFRVFFFVQKLLPEALSHLWPPPIQQICWKSMKKSWVLVFLNLFFQKFSPGGVIAPLGPSQYKKICWKYSRKVMNPVVFEFYFFKKFLSETLSRLGEARPKNDEFWDFWPSFLQKISQMRESHLWQNHTIKNCLSWKNFRPWFSKILPPQKILATTLIR